MCAVLFILYYGILYVTAVPMVSIIRQNRGTIFCSVYNYTSN